MVELQFIIERRPDNPRLIIGFNGSSPAPLVAALSPDTSVERIIPLLDPEWIEEQAEVVNDYGVAKLSSYLAQPHVSLEQAISTFREVFLGE
jgi:type VI secretion system protein ImpM